MCKQWLCKKNPFLGKIFAKFYAVLSRKWVCRDFTLFGGIFQHILELYCTFWHFCCTIWVFWAFYADLSRIRFVVIYALFLVKLFLLKPCSCKKVVILHLWWTSWLPNRDIVLHLCLFTDCIICTEIIIEQNTR